MTMDNTDFSETGTWRASGGNSRKLSTPCRDLEKHVRFLNCHVTSSCEASSCEVRCQALSSSHCEGQMTAGNIRLLRAALGYSV